MEPTKRDEIKAYALGLMQRGELLEKEGKLEEALADFNEGLPLLKEHGLAMAYSWYLMNRIQVLEKLGRIEEAEAYYDEYLAHEQPDDPETASYLVNRAETLHRSGHLVEAVARYTSAIRFLAEEANRVEIRKEEPSLLPKRSPQIRLADCLVNRAGALRGLGMLAEAVASYDAASPYYEAEAKRVETFDDSQAFQKFGPLGDYANCLMSRAMTLKEMGKLLEAFASFDDALPALRKLDQVEEAVINDEEEDIQRILNRHARQGTAYCLLNRGTILLALLQPDEALADLDEALRLLRRKEDTRGQALCLMNRANVLQMKGEFDEALACYDEVQPLLQEHGWPADIAMLLMNRAGILFQQGQLDQALANYNAALPILREHAAPADYARCLVCRATTLGAQGHLGAAVMSFRDAREVLGQARRLGRIDESSLEFVQAWAPLFDTSIWTALECHDADQAYAAVCDGKAGLIGDLRYRLPPDVTAPAAVCTARSALTDWMRNHVPQPPQMPDPTVEAIEQFREEVTSFVTERDLRTRCYLSAWGQHYHAYDAQRSAPAIDPMNRDRIQQCLPHDWAILDFWRTDESEFTAFVLFRDAFNVVKLPIAFDTLKPNLERLLQALHNPEQRDPNLTGLADLHRCLFQPLIPLLRQRGINGLYLVPQDFLHHFPLHASWSVEEKRYLCDEFAIAYLPSAALLPRLPKPDPSGSVFVLADPEHGTEHCLPFAHWEGQQLAAKLGLRQGQVFLGAEGTLAATQAWANAGLVHFGCHGLGDPDFAPRSHLRLADDLLLAHDVLYRCPPLKEGAVVILNGCQTSIPDARAVNEGLGLMTAFLVRGAGLVLSTQWSVNDACAAEMVLHFVEHLRIQEATPAQSLKVAQQHVRRLKISDVAKVEYAVRGMGQRKPQPRLYDNPVFWGAFQLVGRVT